MNIRWASIAIVVLTLFFSVNGVSDEIGNYLILQDIGRYKLDRPEKIFAGEPPIGGPRIYDGAGFIGATGHFPDHKDTTYEIMYIGGGGFPSPTVQVTQHSGADSDRWLLHELDHEFRNYYGIPDLSFDVITINGNTIFAFGSGGWDYRWLSGNKVIVIEYTDLQMKKPQPIEVVRAYLTKHPSTLPAMTLLDLRSKEHKTRWVKDEMERRLWLCDKWLMQVQLGKAQLDETLETIVESMNVFLNYREKYYNIGAKSETQLLSGYLEVKNGTAIKGKLSDYKTWWAVNKGKSISVP